MPALDGSPLHERVFTIKSAIRKAGFRAHGRARLHKDGRVIMGVVVPVAFDARDVDADKVKSELRREVSGDEPQSSKRRKT